jgi:hypothetical protein
MAIAATTFRLLGVTVMAFYALLGIVLIAGEAFTDLRTAQAVLAVAVWLVPMAAMTLLALLLPRLTTVVLDVLVGLVVVAWIWFAMDPAFWQDIVDDHGPVLAIGTFAVAVPAGFLGLRRPAPAGVQLLLLGLAPLGALLAVEAVRDGGGRPLDLFATSGGAGILPTVLAAALFLVSAAFSAAAQRRRDAARPA